MSYITFLSGIFEPTFKYLIDDNGGDVVYYHLVYKDTGVLYGDGAGWDISYTRSTQTWSEGPGPSVPTKLNSVNNIATATSTLVNPVKVFGFDSWDMYFEFNNPHRPPNTAAFLSYGLDTTYPNDTPLIIGTVGSYNWAAGVVFLEASIRIRFNVGFSFDTSTWTVLHETPTLITSYSFDHVNGTDTVGYISPVGFVRSNYTGTWTLTLNGNNNLSESVVVHPPDDDPPDDDPPENDPPPTPVFVPRSARRGNLNFW